MRKKINSVLKQVKEERGAKLGFEDKTRKTSFAKILICKSLPFLMGKKMYYDGLDF